MLLNRYEPDHLFIQPFDNLTDCVHGEGRERHFWEGTASLSNTLSVSLYPTPVRLPPYLALNLIDKFLKLLMN